MFFSAPLGKEGCHTPLGDGVRLAAAGCRKRVATALAVFNPVLSGSPWSDFKLKERLLWGAGSACSGVCDATREAGVELVLNSSEGVWIAEQGRV